jgi:hypothetical protein
LLFLQGNVEEKSFHRRRTDQWRGGADVGEDDYAIGDLMKK